LGNLLQVQQGSQQRIFTYDSLSRLKTAKNPEQVNPSSQMVATSYDYDDASNLTLRTNPNLTTVGFNYDGLNRVKTKTVSVGGTWTYAYDTGTNGKGKLVSVTQTGGDGYYYDSYDAMGRVTASHQTTTTTQGGSQSYTLSYGYDLAGNMTKQVYPSLKEYRTDYDSAGRVSQVSRYIANVFDKKYAGGFSYTPHGAVSAMSLSYSSGVPVMNETMNYNSRLQPTLMETRKASNNELLLGLDFTYGTTATTNNGNMRTQAIRIGGTTTPTWTINQSFTYDALNRLQTADEPSAWHQDYSYDRFGNRWVTSTGYVPDPNLCPTQSSHVSAATNRILLSGFSYDPSGNQKTQIRNSQTENYDYDSENRLLKINDGATGEYVYDGDGRRVKKIDTSGTTVFVYNAAGQLIAEYHSDPVPPPTGGGGTSYLTTDHLGSTRLVTSASGVVRARYDYLPFGEEVPSTLGVRGSVGGYGGSDGTRQKFTQKERDNESGLGYFGARYYSSPQGRFTSPDPLLSSGSVYDPQTWNHYCYTLNNPLKYIDPFGLYVWDSTLGGSLTDEELKKAKGGKEIIAKRESFRAALARAAISMLSDKISNAQRQEIFRSLNSYGQEGDANGVSIANGRVKPGADAETSSTSEYGFNVDPNNGALTPTIKVTLSDRKSTVDAEAVAHEGSHVADRLDLGPALTRVGLTGSTKDFINAPENITTYQTEFRAYMVGSAVAQGSGRESYNAQGIDYWNSGWRAADRETKRQAGVNRVIERLYNATPRAPGPRLMEFKK
jgi:RHS repeat-associated protein